MTGNRYFGVKDITLAWPTQGKTIPHPYKLLEKQAKKNMAG